LAALVERVQRRGRIQLEELGSEPTQFPSDAWRAGLVASGKRLNRQAAAGTRRDELTYLARLVAGMLGDETPDPRVAEYLTLVDRVLEDRRVTAAEADGLVRAAAAWGLTRADVLEAHRAYLESLASEALADGRVSDAERRDLEAVCDLSDCTAPPSTCSCPHARRPAPPPRL
jgi:hypothetical protein